MGRTPASQPAQTPPAEEQYLHRNTRDNLATTEEAEALTTPEALLEFEELTEEEQEDDNLHPTQSTLGGGTFHTAKPTTHLGDGDESQDWQIEQAKRGANH